VLPRDGASSRTDEADMLTSGGLKGRSVLTCSQGDAVADAEGEAVGDAVGDDVGDAVGPVVSRGMVPGVVAGDVLGCGPAGPVGVS
jgi:hypothetical protein